MVDVGEVIQYLRKKKKLSLARLARMAGVSTTTIVRIERYGDGQLSTIEKVLDALGYDLEIMKKEGAV